MKRILIYAVVLSCIIWGCKQSKKVSQEGVYKLEKQTVSGGKKDTTYQRTQVKIYTPQYFVYAGIAPDSSVGFGVGSYKLDTGNKIIESNIYSSGSLDSARFFNVVVTKTDKGYTQVIPDLAVVKGVKYKLTEEYTKLPSADTSVLDGVWRLDKTFWVKGKDTTRQNQIQYKAFWGGHFMFIHRYPLDQAATKFKNGFGYGDFSLKNDTLSEEDEMSSHAMLLHRKFAIKITFNGRDEYSQVINDSKTNEQTTEIYKRLK
ncbi:MAG TPA: hypothetical protein VK668_01915 [Mucilaginibacter sp.]|nr:hypothetical protein [Mucilaginibacter sp.]